MNIIFKPKQEIIYANELQPGDIFEFSADKDQYYMRLDLTDTVVNLATGKTMEYTPKSLCVKVDAIHISKKMDVL